MHPPSHDSQILHVNFLHLRWQSPRCLIWSICEGLNPKKKKKKFLLLWVPEIHLTDKVCITKLEIILNGKGSGKVTTAYVESTPKCHCCIIYPFNGKGWWDKWRVRVQNWKVKDKSRKERMRGAESSQWVTFHEHTDKESTLEPTKPESTKIYFCTEGE